MTDLISRRDHRCVAREVCADILPKLPAGLPRRPRSPVPSIIKRVAARDDV